MSPSNLSLSSKLLLSLFNQIFFSFNDPQALLKFIFVAYTVSKNLYAWGLLMFV